METKTVKIAFAIASILTLFACTKEKITVKGRLYYTPNCTSINGHIYVPNSDDSVKVFKEKVDQEFQSSNLPVWVTYTVSGNQQQNQQTGCEFGEVVDIKKLELR